MGPDHTIPQSNEELARAQSQSLKRQHPPTTVPGYDVEEFLGQGAYGEVWVGTDRNTGRRVAIKFYNHRGGLDWSLLKREVEKLAFLFSDRNVVQLVDVAWDAQPPYYIMEYLEHGSLDERLRAGGLPADEAVDLFREIAVGLAHAHGKGVLHCDLKPANILLGQDQRPRLADFGQSRLSHEQTPALGTLFYMAPEQADLQAVPDARWDVYALGAVLYAMLTGQPPFRTDHAATQLETTGTLDERLSSYRKLIADAPRPKRHRQLAGVDRDLAEIVDRCLERQPGRRYANVQSVLTALDQRQDRRARRPILVLGALGPLLLLLIASIFVWEGIRSAEESSEVLVRRRALEGNLFAAELAAEKVSRELADYFQTAEDIAADPRLAQALQHAAENPELQGLFTQIDEIERSAQDNNDRAQRQEPLQEQIRAMPMHKGLIRALEEYHRELNRGETQEDEWRVAGIVIDDNRGYALSRYPPGDTTGRNFCFRTYFAGGVEDRPRSWRAKPGECIRRTNLSAVFRSSATGKWVVAISAPIWKDPKKEECLGVMVMTVEVRRLIEKFEGRSEQFAVLVDGRGSNRGLVLQHPLFNRLAENFDYRRFAEPKYRVPLDGIPDRDQLEAAARDVDRVLYFDPMRIDDSGEDFVRPWLAVREPVVLMSVEAGGDVEAPPADMSIESDPPQAHSPESDSPKTSDPVEGEGSDAKPARPQMFLTRLPKAMVSPLRRTPTGETGLYIVMQEDFQAITSPVKQLGRKLIRGSLLALVVLLLVMTALWGVVILALGDSPRLRWISALRRRVGLSGNGNSLRTGSSVTPRKAGASDIGDSHPA